MQAGTSFTSACVAVMWRIPPPNSVTYNGGLDPLVANDFNFI